jgi:Spx/MgsR family transcriptional regulator
MPILYGIPNCTTVAKARKWIESNSIEYSFHDYKKLGIDAEHLKKWCTKFGWDKVLNMQGMMWRKASDLEKAKVVDQESAIDFMINTPNAIKRPIVELEDGGILRGFDAKDWGNIFLKQS